MSETDGSETIQAKRQRFSELPRACEACSVRKVRCNRLMPCSNCVAYNVVCKAPGFVSNKRTQSDRISLLEDHIATLESRLRSVEDTLASDGTPSNPTVEDRGSADMIDHESPQLYEGESSFSKQLTVASHIAEARCGGTLGLDTSFSDLHALAGTTGNADEHRFSQTQSVLFSKVNESCLPLSFVTAVLRRICDKKPIFCYGYFLTNVSMIRDLCNSAYKAISITTSHAASVYGILYFLLKELSAIPDPLCRDYDLSKYTKKCAEGLTSLAESPGVLTVPSFESVLSLALGALKAQEDAKPFLVSTLISTAANHCRTLGYHRQIYKRKREGNSDSLTRLFWSVYVSDKTLSLLLGRTSYLQDFDIDADLPNISEEPSCRAWDENFVMAIRLARLQGQIYDKLYSPYALKASLEQRQLTIIGLTSDMRRWYDQFTKIDSRRAAYSEIWQASRKHWDINYYSTLTSLLRASANPETGWMVTSQCFASARLSLQSHISCLRMWEETEALSSKDYADWVLNYSSFTPFLVIFLHAISSADPEDLSLLDNVVRTLHNIRESSKHTEKLYQISSILSRVAKNLAGTQNKFAEAYQAHEDVLRFEKQDSMPHLLRNEAVEESSRLQMADYLEDWEVHDMDYVLASWANGQSTTLNMF